MVPYQRQLMGSLALRDEIELIATTSFGLEAVVSRELKRLGYDRQTVSDGRVTFWADPSAVARANLWLRSAERVLIKIASFQAHDFGELFDQTAQQDWARWIAVDGQFPVRGKSVRSQLHSVRDCQAIVKKAIVEKLRKTRGGSWLPEIGALFAVEVSIVRDVVTLTIDTTGAGLHKRGYRRITGPSPLKETLAAALVQLSFWEPSRPFLDPFCGTGTIPIEAALIGRNRAPGLQRTFAAEGWSSLHPSNWRAAREEALDRVVRGGRLLIFGSDVDSAAVETACRHAQNAGVAGDTQLVCRSFADAQPRGEFGCLVCNPPYGERSGNVSEAEGLARETGRAFRRFNTWSLYVLTALTGFEQICRRRADRRRKLYNGRIECTYYQFHGPRPPRSESDPLVHRAGVSEDR